MSAEAICCGDILMTDSEQQVAHLDVKGKSQGHCSKISLHHSFSLCSAMDVAALLHSLVKVVSSSISYQQVSR